MLKKILFELVAIRKELQAIRSYLEPKKVSMCVKVNVPKNATSQPKRILKCTGVSQTRRITEEFRR